MNFSHQLLRAVHYLHPVGVIRRHIKTKNVLYKSSGAVKRADFGLNRQLDVSVVGSFM